MDFIGRIAGLLLRPDETMREIVRRPRIVEAVAIIFIYAILYAVSNVVTMSQTTLIINDPALAGMGTPESMKTFMMIFDAVIAFIMAITLWPITAGILHVFSRVFGGAGRFIPDMMTAIGYTYLIKIPAIAIVIILALCTPPSVITYNTPLVGANEGTNANSTTYSFTYNLATTGGNGLLTMIGSVVSIIGIILSSLLGILAVKHAEGLRTRDAAIVVGVPLLIFLVFTIATYVASYLIMNIFTGA